jgi:hypothetical protein
MFSGVDFRTLQGRIIVVVLFALSWVMQAAHKVLTDGYSMPNALWFSLGYSIFLLPVIGILAWAVWKMAFKKEKGLFPFIWATAVTLYSAFRLVA